MLTIARSAKLPASAAAGSESSAENSPMRLNGLSPRSLFSRFTAAQGQGRDQGRGGLSSSLLSLQQHQNPAVSRQSLSDITRNLKTVRALSCSLDAL